MLSVVLFFKCNKISKQYTQVFIRINIILTKSLFVNEKTKWVPLILLLRVPMKSHLLKTKPIPMSSDSKYKIKIKQIFDLY